MQVTVANMETWHDFIATDFLDTEILIGLDFMQQNYITLDAGHGLFQTPYGSCKFFDKPKNVEKTMKIRCKKTTVVQPNTIQYYPASFLRPELITRDSLNHTLTPP